jgi:hypothetical protein
MNYIKEEEVNAISSASVPMATCTLDGVTVNVCNGRGKLLFSWVYSVASS